MNAKLLALILLFTTLQASSQSTSLTIPRSTSQPSPDWTPPLSRWTLSLNPWGIFEPPAAAIGLGVGYRLNNKMELWEETSLLRNLFTTNTGPINGIRQIIQLKKFLDKNNHLFAAAEIRYKYYSLKDSGLFINANTRDTLKNFGYASYHNVIGAAIQIGYRTPLSPHSRFSIELTGGIGIKNKYINNPAIPSSYKFTRYSNDFNSWVIMQTPGADIYTPGSLRLIYSIP